MQLTKTYSYAETAPRIFETRFPYQNRFAISQFLICAPQFLNGVNFANCMEHIHSLEILFVDDHPTHPPSTFVMKDLGI